MTSTEAKELLLLHSFQHPDAAASPKAERGFLGSLRPYGGHLIDENFHEVMEALKALAPTLTGKTVDREVITALWAICQLARAWGIYPEGMLRRNGLIKESDVDKLERWVDMISYATFCLLDGTGEEVAFEMYLEAERFRSSSDSRA